MSHSLLQRLSLTSQAMSGPGVTPQWPVQFASQFWFVLLCRKPPVHSSYLKVSALIASSLGWKLKGILTPSGTQHKQIWGVIQELSQGPCMTWSSWGASSKPILFSARDCFEGLENPPGAADRVTWIHNCSNRSKSPCGSKCNEKCLSYNGLI